MKKIAISWYELILFILLVLSGMGFWSLTEKQISVDLEQQEPNEEDFLYEVTIYESELSAVEKQLAVFQEQQVQTIVNHRKLDLSLAYIESIYPELQSAAPVPGDVLLVPTETLRNYIVEYDNLQDVELKNIQQYYPSLINIADIISETQSVPLEVVINYINTQVELANTELLSKELDIQLTELIGEKLNLSQGIADARASGNRKLMRERRDFERVRVIQVLSQSSLYVIVYLIISCGFTYLLLNLKKNIKDSLNIPLVFGAAFIVLFLLFIYQAFDLLGIALASTIILLLILPFISQQYISTKPKDKGADNESISDF